MVYCGKASQGCQNCRTRRIKCDKVRPDCSQCIRAGKKCPGYRNLLELMFRDESTKVIQRAHAQWGAGDAQGPPSPAPSNLSSSVSVAGVTPPGYTASASGSGSGSGSAFVPRMCTPIDPEMGERGLQFYVNRYLIGHPDEPRTVEHLSEAADWLWDPSVQDVMTAVGLAGLSNINGDKSLMIQARRSYGSALRQTGKLIATTEMPPFEVTMRSIVMLAMFELVKGTQDSLGRVHAHVMGGVAMLRSWCPMPAGPFKGVRALVQLCYCLFIPTYLAGLPLVPQFFECVKFARPHLEPMDHPALDLGQLIARLNHWSAYIRSRNPADGHRETTSVLQELLQLEDDLIRWEQKLEGIWLYRVERAPKLPPSAIFQGEYHVYHDMWVARVWNHYRWARIILGQTILKFAESCPRSGSQLVSAADRQRLLEAIQSTARDALKSIPTHWRHPLLDEKSLIPVEKPGGAGSGAAGIPVLLYQLQLIVCAPGVPLEYLDWAYDVVETIWGDLGMLLAKSMMESMMAYRGALQSPDSGISVAS